MATISSIQTGSVVTEGDPETRDAITRVWTSAFRKSPVVGTVRAGDMGIEGDEVADTKHHGGVDKAILCYAESHYAKWSAESPDLDFGPGGFGENLTIAGADEPTVCIGDVYRVGDCEIQVCQPRQPCWKVARRWGDKTMTKRVAETGRTGWYVRVTAPGEFAAGMPLERVQRTHPEWTVARVNDLFYGRINDRSATIELMALPELSDEWKKDIS